MRWPIFLKHELHKLCPVCHIFVIKNREISQSVSVVYGVLMSQKSTGSFPGWSAFNPRRWYVPGKGDGWSTLDPAPCGSSRCHSRLLALKSKLISELVNTELSYFESIYQPNNLIFPPIDLTCVYTHAKFTLVFLYHTLKSCFIAMFILILKLLRFYYLKFWTPEQVILSLFYKCLRRIGFIK